MMAVIGLVVAILVTAAAGSPAASAPAQTPTQAAALQAAALSSSATAFTDIGGHWAQHEIELLALKGVTEALSGGAFEPEVQVNRGDLARMLVLGLGHGGEVDALLSEPSVFADVAIEDPDRPYIELAYELGIVNGYPDRTFRADSQISRSEMTAMILRALGWETLAQATTASGQVYPDQAEIAPWAMGYALLAYETGIIKGYSDGTFRPLASTTRSQAAVLVARMLGAMGRLYDLSGTVKTIDLVDGAMGLETMAGDRRLVVYTGTRVYRNGQPASLGDLNYFDEVQVVLDAIGRVTFLDAHLVTVEGTFSAFDPLSLKIDLAVNVGTGQDGVPATALRSYTVLPEAAVFRNGKADTLSGLKAGDHLLAILKVVDGSNRVRAIDAVRVSVTGVFNGFDPVGGVLTIAVPAGPDLPDLRPYQLASSAAVYLDGQKAAATDIRQGDSIELTLDAQSGLVVFVNAERPR